MKIVSSEVTFQLQSSSDSGWGIKLLQTTPVIIRQLGSLAWSQLYDFYFLFDWKYSLKHFICQQFGYFLKLEIISQKHIWNKKSGCFAQNRIFLLDAVLLRAK